MTKLVPANQRAITMTVDAQGKLRAFGWLGETFAIAHIASAWRIDDGWWAFRVWREYALVTTEQKRLFLVYRDLLTNQWFVERVYN